MEAAIVTLTAGSAGIMITSLSLLLQKPMPVPRTPLIGREDDIAEVVALLARSDTPLLTLTDPSGVGKTRMALRAAVASQEHFSDGAVFVPLGSASRRRGSVEAALALRLTGSMTTATL